MSDSKHQEPTSVWQSVEPDAAAALERFGAPLEALATGEIPAIVLRNVYSQEACRRLMRHLIDGGLLFDPSQPMPAEFAEASIPEGFFREGTASTASRAWRAEHDGSRTRIDIGTSLGYRGSDKEGFLTHSQQTHALFDRLFRTFAKVSGLSAQTGNPIRILYEQLQQLATTQRVVTAYEPDGRLYGPAILRAHYGGYTYKPHFDSVRLREKRSNYAVYQFEHQFAGVLVLQNSEAGETSSECRLHRCLWQPELDDHLTNDTFHAYASSHDIQHVDVHLEAGDLYFFNTRTIHEVPGVAANLPRVVLATFIGYSRDTPEIFVWS